MKKVICFGEVMARFSPPEQLRLRQAMPGTMEVTFAGAEANVAANIAALGGETSFVTALPSGEITECCLAALRAARIDVSQVLLRETGRFGIYFVETGANQRGGMVVYDRDGTTFGVTEAVDYNWNTILAHGDWFHTTGISAGLSLCAAEATLAAVQAAHTAGLQVSCDLNYRRKLWRWDPAQQPADLARRTFAQMLPFADMVIGNAFDVAHAAGMNPPSETSLSPDVAAEIARTLVRRFPQLKWVAITLREACSANHNRWGAMLYQGSEGVAFSAPTKNGLYAPFDIPRIVDRIGTGDAFAGALIFALQTPDLSEPGKAVHFAAAASCLAHSIKGDFNFCSRTEVESLMDGNWGGAVSR